MYNLPVLLSKVHQYIESTFVKEDEKALSIRKKMKDHQLPMIEVSLFVGKLLYLLTLTHRPKRVLEIGTLGGYSTFWIASALSDECQMISIEKEDRFAKLAKRNIVQAGLDRVVTIRIGDAHQELEEMVQFGEKPFDLIFLDADKTGYPQYLEPMISLSRPGTLILIDNLIRQGKTIEPLPQDPQASAVAAFNQMIAKDPRLESIIIPTMGGYHGGNLDGLGFCLVKGL